MDLYGLGKRLIPRTLRTQLRRVLKETVEPIDEVQLLRSRVQSLEASVFHLAPEEIVITEAVERYIERFREDYEVEGAFETAVSKRDVMFRYLEYFQGNLPRAYWEYLVTGYQAFETFDRIVAEQFGGFDRIEAVLDFASGYGRMTRFLVRSAARDQVWVSDIKARAVEFQKEKLGVHGFVAPASAAGFPTEMRFDAIFVASFFSHIPESEFGEWLRVLCNGLSERGLLAFSVNDISLVEPVDRADFYYREVNEEGLFDYIDDETLEGDAYGTAYVSESFVRDQLSKLGFGPEQVQRLPKGLWDIQDLYLVRAAKGVI